MSSYPWAFMSLLWKALLASFPTPGERGTYKNMREKAKSPGGIKA
ncbi:hypothetical protein CsSME_00011739 [Camellia sinensis var. sinensis]